MGSSGHYRIIRDDERSIVRPLPAPTTNGSTEEPLKEVQQFEMSRGGNRMGTEDISEKQRLRVA